MYLLNITVYWYALNTTVAHKILQVHSTQTDELINSMFLYVPIFRRHLGVIWEGGRQADESINSLA